MKASFLATLLNMLAGAKERETQEHVEFMQFYARLVMSISKEGEEIFGNMGGINVHRKGETGKNWGIELNPVDLAWWKTKIEQEGWRFDQGVHFVKAKMLSHINSLMKDYKLTDEERLFFLNEDSEQRLLIEEKQ